MIRLGLSAVLAVLLIPASGLTQTTGRGFVIPEQASEILAAQRTLHLELQQAIPPGVGSAQTKVCNPNASAFNWRDYGKVTGAKYQDTCGSCWAFAAIAAVETSYMVYRNTKALIPDLSEQEVLDCAGEYRAIEYGQVGYDCAGGWFEAPFRMAQTRGFAANVSYPSSPPPGYRGVRGACEKSIVTERIRATSWTPLPSVRGPNSWVAPDYEIKEALCTYGGVVSALNSEGFPAGKFDAPIPGARSNTAASKTSTGQWVDHAIQIVGWDNNEGVWIIKNSWGEAWGHQGFARIPYDTRNIGFMATAVQSNTALVVQALPSAASADFLNTRQLNINALPRMLQLR